MLRVCNYPCCALALGACNIFVVCWEGAYALPLPVSGRGSRGTAPRAEVATSATSGIVAALFYFGQTTPSRFKLPFDFPKDSVCNVKIQSELATFLSNITPAIIDEGPIFFMRR